MRSRQSKHVSGQQTSTRHSANQSTANRKLASRPRHAMRSLRFEEFEPRYLMATQWIAQGPFGASNGQVEGIVNKPVTGAVHVVVAHPTNPDIIWIGGTNGGIWRTTNATSANPQWTPVFDNQSSLSIGAIALDQADANVQTLYAGNGRYSSFARLGGTRNGVYKSIDGGQSWQTVPGNSLMVGKNVSGIAANGNNVVVSVNTADAFNNGNIGIFRSTNGGTSFTQVSGGAGTGLPTGSAFDLFVDPTNANTLYTSIAFASGGLQGIYKSIDGGATWARVSNPTMNNLVVANTSNIEIAVGRQDNVYVAILNAGNLAGLFRSGNGGQTWTALDRPATNENGIDVGLNPSGGKGPTSGTPEEIAGGQGSIHFSMAVDPNNANIVYVGGDRQPRSNGDAGTFPNSIGAQDFSGRLFRGDATRPVGQQFVHLTHRNNLGAAGGGTASNTSPHADSRDMIVDAAGNLLEVDDGGVYRRTLPNSNQGDWFSLIGSLTTTEMHDVAYDSISNTIMSGNQDTGTTFQSTAGAAFWTSISTGDGGDVAVDDISLAAQGRSIRYSSFQNLGGFRRTTFDAAGAVVATAFPARTVTTGAALTPAFRTPVVVNSINGNRLIIQASNSVYESLNQGNTLVEVGPGLGVLGQLENDALAYGGVLNGVPNPDVLWVGSGSNVFLRSTAAGALTQVASDPTGLLVRDLAIDPEAWTTAVIVTATEVLITVNSGQSWTNISGDLSSQTIDFHSVVMVGGAIPSIVVGSNRGVYFSRLDNLGFWDPLGTQFPNSTVFELDYDANDDVLIAGTLGRGAWLMPSVSIELRPQGGTEDFGDAPNSYGTRLSANGPRHLDGGPTIGTVRDLESNAIPSPLANSDDLSGADDEDGVSFDGEAMRGVVWPITVLAPQGGVLNGWIDFNRNGAFDTSERVFADRILSVGANALGVNVPIAASQGTTFARFRITSAANMATTPKGFASDGEVEDYSVRIRSKPPTYIGEVINGSFTNTNRSGLGTLQLKFDQLVVLANKTDLVLKNRTTNRTVNLSTATLLGNGTSQLTWKMPTGVVLENGRYTFELPRTSVTDANGENLAFNVAGTFAIQRGDVTGDTRVNQQDITIANGNIASNLTTPYRPGDANGDGRVTPADSTLIASLFNANGLAPMGLDFGDIIDTGTGFATSLAKNGARHAVVAGPRLGNLIDAETDALMNTAATGDGADEDGVTFPALTAGSAATINVRVTGAAGFLNSWIDFNGDGDWKDAGEQWLVDRAVVVGVNAIPVTLPTGTLSGIFARFRITSLAGYARTDGFAADGEVEDYRLTVAAAALGRAMGVSPGTTTHMVGTAPSLVPVAGRLISDAISPPLLPIAWKDRSSSQIAETQADVDLLKWLKEAGDRETENEPTEPLVGLARVPGWKGDVSA